MDDIEGRLAHLFTSDKWEEREGCWIWKKTYEANGGYGSVTGSVDGVKKGRSANRVSLRIKLGRPIRPGMLACHTCDVPACVNPDHLYEGTPKQNTGDMISRGRRNNSHVLGGLATRKLTQEQAQEIRNRVASGEYQARLSKEYGVSRQVISDVVRGFHYGFGGVDCRGDKASEMSRRAPRRLTDEQVEACLLRVWSGEPMTSVESTENLPGGTLSRIQSGKTYRGLADQIRQKHGLDSAA